MTPFSAPALAPAQLADCCASARWRERVCGALPYGSLAELQAASAAAFDALADDDWHEAFAAHSAIGAVRDGDRTGAAEQSGLGTADGELRRALLAANAAYEGRFGFVFLIRADGRSGDEILAQLRARIDNPPAVEFATACAQQREITALRLERLWAGAAADGDAPVRAGR